MGTTDNYVAEGLGYGKYSIKPAEPVKDTLADLTRRLECVNADKRRLEAAIAFLEANPGAVALVNSL